METEGRGEMCADAGLGGWGWSLMRTRGARSIRWGTRREDVRLMLVLTRRIARISEAAGPHLGIILSISI